METPICRFVEAYAAKAPVRLHMPGHKGQGSPVAPYDLTEVEGADVLTPNLTEAHILTGIDDEGQDVSDEYVHRLLDALLEMGAKNVVV